MNKIKVTLAMPVYNVAKYIERALLSALNQTYDHLEIILVDDKGPDDSMEIARRVIASHPRGSIVRIIEHEHNKGAGATRNTSIDQATGEYLYFMDSDDTITNDAIETLVGQLDDNTDTELVAGSAFYIDNTVSTPVGYRNTVSLTGDLCLWKHFISEQELLSIPTWNKLYKTEFLRSSGIRCVSKQLNEDAWFTFQIMFQIRNCVLVNTPTYQYYKNEGSTCDHRSFNEQKREFITTQYIEISRLKKEYLTKFKHHPLYPRILEEIMNDCIGYSFKIMVIQISPKLDFNQPKLLRRLKAFYLSYTSDKLAKAIDEILSYPETQTFIESGIEHKETHLRFYRLGQASKFKKISFLNWEKIKGKAFFR